CFGRLALHGTGNEHDIYRYVVPLIVGGLSGYLIGFMKDKWLRLNRDLRATNEILKKEINEHKQAKEALKDALKELKDFMDAIPDIAYKINPDLSITNWNRAAEEILGYSPEEIRRMNALEIVHEEDHEKVGKSIQKVYEKGGAEIEACLVAKDGRKHPYLLSGRISKDSEGNVTGLAGVAKDLTKTLKAEEERRNLEVRLQQAQKMEVIGTLAGGVAHDLNNILSGIVSYPELILMELPEDSPLIKPIMTIQKSGKKAASIVNDLLTLARRGVAISAVVNLNTTISEQLRSPEFEKLMSFYPDIKVETRFEKDLLNIKGSTTHLSKSIMNLISNAAEAMPNEGKILITTGNQYIDRPIKGYDRVEEGDYVTVTVCDTGIGLTLEDMGKIFDPFYTKKSMGRSGTGLGMSVVWGTVKDHKGYIDIQSTLGKGTTLTLYFPITREEIDKDEAVLPVIDYMGNGESVLVVDDVREQREIANGMLSKLGYCVTSVSSGEAAIEYLKINSADLIVLDMIMEPGINGRKTYEKIIKDHPNQKAIIASGFSETDDVKNAQELGAGRYIKKPYTFEKIGVAVRDELKK
ncbi:MAG: response regulator, partial [Desulfobacterales bacterium]|nr:response regulator [Desulfobacterales bacterium]